MNPGGSVKDRAALGLVLWAEKTGRIQPGGTIVEGTAGNTGIGLAHVCRARGYKCVIYMPNVRLSLSRSCPSAPSSSRSRANSRTRPRTADPEPGEDRPAAHARRRGVPGPRCVGAAFSFQPTRGARRLGRAVEEDLLELTLVYPPAAVAFENPENYNHRASASSRCRLSTRSDLAHPALVPARRGKTPRRAPRQRRMVRLTLFSSFLVRVVRR